MERLLLLGNSRWHWADVGPQGLHCWHEPPPVAAPAWGALRAWAAVGPLPSAGPPPPQRRIDLAQVPLQQLPAWLGIDRALVGWRAWRRQGHGVLVADAGTALSLTWIDAAGRFRGGRISAGLGLQLRSLGEGTALLPRLETPAAGLSDALPAWPTATEEALLQGCVQATAAAISAAWRQLSAPMDPPCRLWLTGGDAPCLAPLLRAGGIELEWAPDLALEALAALPAVGLIS